MNRTIPILFLSLIIGSIGCSRPEDLTVAEVNDIVRQIIIDDSLDLRVLCARTYRMQVIGSDTAWGGRGLRYDAVPPYMSAFSPDDIAFLQRQNLLLKDWSVRGIGLRYYDRRDSAFTPVEVTDSCSPEDHSVPYIEVPLVSPDRSQVILGYGATLHHNSGWGVRVLYVKENRRWVKKKEYGRWIS